MGLPIAILNVDRHHRTTMRWASGVRRPSPWPIDIPKVIHLSCATSRVADGPSTVLQYWKALNPSFEVRLHNDSAAREFIVAAFGVQMLRMYDMIPSSVSALRSDFWRVLYLLRHGGVYADSDIEPMVPVDEMMPYGNPTFVTSSSLNNGLLNPHIIVARAGDDLLNRTIVYMVREMQRGKKFALSQASRSSSNRTLGAPLGVMSAPGTAGSAWAGSAPGPWSGRWWKWSVPANMHAAMRERNFTHLAPRAFVKGGALGEGVHLLREVRVSTERCERCVLDDVDHAQYAAVKKNGSLAALDPSRLSRNVSRKATIDPADNRILMFNKYMHSTADGQWRASTSAPIRAHVCPVTCMIVGDGP